MGAEDDFRARDIGRDHLKRVAAAEFRGARATRFGARRTVRSARTRIEKKRRKKIQCEKGDDVVSRGLGPPVAAATRNEGGAAAHPVPTVSFFKDTRARKTSVKSTFRHSWDEVLPPSCSFGHSGETPLGAAVALPRDGGPQRRFPLVCQNCTRVAKPHPTRVETDTFATASPIINVSARDRALPPRARASIVPAHRRKLAILNRISARFRGVRPRGVRGALPQGPRGGGRGGSAKTVVD